MTNNHTTISGQGQRPYNEDSFFLNADQHFYMVCDGVGGSNRGDIASKKACEYFSEFLERTGDFSENGMEEALQYTERKFDEYIEHNPDTKGMATTLTVLKFLSGNAIIGHIGDSRVYQIRNGEILFKTQDHSFVNELVASGFLTSEEAKVHPKRNKITRAIQSTEFSTLIDVNVLDDIFPGDYFMLCSDGILESVDDDFIKEQFVSGNTLENIREKISEICAANSNDNYTAVLLKISE